MPGQIGYYPNQWIYSQFDWSNSTGHEILLKMGANSLRLIVCLPGRIGYHSNEVNWHLSQWIYSQFNRSNSTRHEILLKMGVNSLRLHCMPVWSNWVSSQWIYTQFDQYFMPGQIGWKFIEITPSSNEK